MLPRQMHKQTTTVTCSDNGKSMIAEVISFIPNQKLIVSLERSIKMEMSYNNKNNLYMAKQSGLEFASSGPETINIRPIR
jgi:hypothetical protein